MFLAGIKFGIGFWIGTVAVTLAVMSLVALADQIQRYRTVRAESRKSGRRRLEEALAARSSAPKPATEFRDEDGRAVFRTVILWRDADEPERRRKEPHYRY